MFFFRKIKPGKIEVPDENKDKTTGRHNRLLQRVGKPEAGCLFFFFAFLFVARASHIRHLIRSSFSFSFTLGLQPKKDMEKVTSPPVVQGGAAPIAKISLHQPCKKLETNVPEMPKAVIFLTVPRSPPRSPSAAELLKRKSKTIKCYSMCHSLLLLLNILEYVLRACIPAILFL